MDKRVETVLATEKSLFERHKYEQDLPLNALKKELEPIFLENGWRQPMAENPSVLLIHSEANGDFVMSSGLIRAIRKCYPQAFITLMIADVCLELAERCPYVDEVKVRPQIPMDTTWQEDMEIFLSELPSLLARHYDMGFTWHEGLGAQDKLWLYFAGVRERVGYDHYVIEGAEVADDFQLWYDLLTLKVPRDRNKAVRDSEKALSLLEAVTGECVLDRSVEVWTDEEDERRAAEVLRGLRVRGYRKIYALMPGASEERRRWPVERWAKVAAAILSREPRTGMVVLGGSKEQKIAQWLAGELNENYPGRVISVAGKLTFRGTAALLNRCQKYLGNDTGAVHLAVAQKVPVLVAYPYPLDLKIYTISAPVRFAPWGVPTVQVFPKEHRDDCHDCDGHGCSRKDEAHCILGISMETMLYAYEALNREIVRGTKKTIRFC